MSGEGQAGTPDDEALDLMARVGFCFTGTVQHLGADMPGGLAAAGRAAAIVHVDEVLHAPDALAGHAGSDITVQLAPGEGFPQPGERATIFTDIVDVGDTL